MARRNRYIPCTEASALAQRRSTMAWPTFQVPEGGKQGRTWYARQARTHGFELHYPPSASMIALLTDAQAASVSKTVASTTGRIVSIRATTVAQPKSTWDPRLFSLVEENR